jgi:hypothetical protein
MQTQAPEDNVVLMRRRAEISGDALLKSAAALRLHAEDSAQCQYLLHSKSARLLSQAADEIERLRRALQVIETWARSDRNWGQRVALTPDEVIDVCRKALENWK